MQVSVSDAKARLTDLVRRAEEGDEVVITRHGQPAVRLVPVVNKQRDMVRFNALIDKLVSDAEERGKAEPCAARSADFLYGEDGMPA